MPRALTERLGTEGADALSTVLESVHAEWSDDVLTLAAERFDRTLSCEISKLRVEVAKELTTLRVEVSKDVSAVRQDISAVRVDLFKWSFLFWIGQVAAVAGLLGFMLRSS
jgi:hypothetical protein